MRISKLLIGGVAALVLTATAVASADARSRHHRYYHAGYGAYAYAPGYVGVRVAPRSYYYGARPSGPSSMNFELGSGWNNGSLRATQYGRPNHW